MVVMSLGDILFPSCLLVLVWLYTVDMVVMSLGDIRNIFSVGVGLK